MEIQRRKRKLPAIIRWILWVLLVQFVLINISAALNAYRLTHFYEGLPSKKSNPEQNIFAKTWRLFTGPKVYKSKLTETPGFPHQTITLKTKTNIAIDAWYSDADSLPKGTVILFHGVSSNKGMILDEAEEFHSRGYNIMLLDFRGHGNSGGYTTTIGIKESEEVKLAYDYISSKGEKNIFLWGISMGAGAIAKAIADHDLQPSGAILELPVASIYSYMKAKARTLGFPGQPFGFFVTLWAGIEGSFNGFNNKTATFAKKINCPVLMQVAGADNFTSGIENEKIFRSIASNNKKLVIYDDAGHEFLLKKDPVKWRSEIDEFLNKYH